MAIYSDMNGFPESGLPTLKDVKGAAGVNSIKFATPTINSSNGGSFSVGSGYAVNYGYNNTLTLAGAATQASVFGSNNSLTMETATSESVIIGNGNTLNLTGSQTNALHLGFGNSGAGINIGFNNAGGNGITIGSGNPVGATSFSTATVVGVNSSATKSYAIAIGYSTSASGLIGTALGAFNTASGSFSIAMGLGAIGSNTSAVAIGYAVTASASGSAIFGYSSGANIVNSTASSLMIGYNTNQTLMTATNTTFNSPIIGTGFAIGYVAKTATYTTVASDHTINCTSGTFTVTLLTAVGNTGKIYVIKNSGTGVITIDANSTETIDGALTQTLNTQYQSYTLQSDGANWIII